MAKFSKEEVPAFIYLVDHIIKKNNLNEVKNIYKDIAHKGSNAYNETTERTIRRVFNLRINLKDGKITEHDYTKPNIDTLNVLTSYYLKKTPLNYSTFKKHNIKEIDAYYMLNKPTEGILRLIFKQQPPKILHLQNQEDKLASIIKELNGLSLEEFVTFWINEKLKESQKNKNYGKIKSELLDFIEYRLNDIEKKKKKSSFFYRIFGSLGLFFVAIDYNEITKDSILEDFTDGYDILEDDDILDDLI